MQHTHIHTGNPWLRLRPILPTPKAKRIDLVLGLIGLVLVAMLVVAWRTTRAPSPAAPLNVPNRASPGNASAVAANVSFEQNTRNLAASNSPEAFQALFRSLRQGEPLTQRRIVLATLKDASPAVVPALMTGLNDTDAGVRAGAAQVLGLRREYQAIGALTGATHDPDASVRREAVTSLGAIGAWQVLPRLDQLEVNDPDYEVRQTAMGVKESFKKEMAQAIGVLTPELRDISVTTGDVPQMYAVTTSNLYAFHGTAWTLVSRLPDAPLAIATGADPTLIYLSTVGGGLYRSLDDGETWEYVQFGLQTPTQLTITAIVVDPQNSRQVYIALASRGVEPGGIKDPLGISVSNDGGATWRSLENSPMDIMTTQLVIDPQEHGYLFGMTVDTPWRYALPAPSAVATDPTRGVAASE